MAKRVLSICYDGAQLAARQRILEQEGYAVMSVLDMAEAKGQYRNGEFDLVLVGYSVPQAHIEELLANLCRLSNAPLLIVLRSEQGKSRRAHILSVSKKSRVSAAQTLYVIAAPHNALWRPTPGIPEARSA